MKTKPVPPKETLYTELYRNRWISLRSVEGYVYSTETRADGALVAMLIVDKENQPNMVLGRFERCPAHFDGFQLASFTGGVEQGNAAYTAVKEIYEEAGYTAEEKDLMYLGTCRPSKSADTVVHLFAWDTSGAIPEVPKGDGSEGEHGAYTKWVGYVDAINSKDPLFSVMLSRYLLTTLESFGNIIS